MCAYQSQGSQERIDMPPLVWREPFRRQRYLRRQTGLEVVIGNFQKRQKFPHHDANVLLVDEGVRQF